VRGVTEKIKGGAMQTNTGQGGIPFGGESTRGIKAELFDLSFWRGRYSNRGDQGKGGEGGV